MYVFSRKTQYTLDLVFFLRTNKLKVNNYNAAVRQNKNTFVVFCVKNSVCSYTTRILTFNYPKQFCKTISTSSSNINGQSEKLIKQNASRKDSNQSFRKEIALRTATRRSSYFSRAGNQSRREGVFTEFFRERATSFINSSSTSRGSKVTSAISVKTSKTTPYSYFPAFYHASTPFVRLKTRRRGSRRKRLKQKLTYITSASSVRQGFRLFAKTFRSSRHTSKNGSFRNKFFAQRESLIQSGKRMSAKSAAIVQNSSNSSNLKAGTRVKVRSKGAANVSSTGTSKTIRELRDEIHRTARRIKIHRVRRARRITVFRRYIRLSRKRGISFDKFKARYRIKLSRSRRWNKLNKALTRVQIRKPGALLLRHKGA